MRAHEQFGNRWSEIAKVLNGRSENNIKNHCESRAVLWPCLTAAQPCTWRKVCSAVRAVVGGHSPHACALSLCFTGNTTLRRRYSAAQRGGGARCKQLHSAVLRAYMEKLELLPRGQLAAAEADDSAGEDDADEDEEVGECGGAAASGRSSARACDVIGGAAAFAPPAKRMRASGKASCGLVGSAAPPVDPVSTLASQQPTPSSSACSHDARGGAGDGGASAASPAPPFPVLPLPAMPALGGGCCGWLQGCGGGAAEELVRSALLQVLLPAWQLGPLPGAALAWPGCATPPPVVPGLQPQAPLLPSLPLPYELLGGAASAAPEPTQRAPVLRPLPLFVPVARRATAHTFAPPALGPAASAAGLVGCSLQLHGSGGAVANPQRDGAANAETLAAETILALRR